MSSIKLYFRLQKSYLKSISSYKTDFFMGCVSFFVNQIFSLCSLLVLYQFTYSIDGWEFYKILLLQSFISLSLSITDMFTDNLWDFSGTIIQKGLFDKYLVRPVHPLLLVIMDRFQIDAIGGVLSSLIMLIVSFIFSKTKFTVFFLFYLLCSCIIIVSIKIIIAALAFVMKKSRAIMYMVFTIYNLCSYPITIYPLFIRIILSTIIPFAFCSYYPAVLIFNRNNLLLLVLFSVSIFSMSFAIYFWNHMMKKYTSSGT